MRIPTGPTSNTSWKGLLQIKYGGSSSRNRLLKTATTATGFRKAGESARWYSTSSIVCMVPSKRTRARAFSTANKEHSQNQLLYQRHPEQDRNTIPRAALGVSTFNTLYWSWYTLDFIPAVNQMAIQNTAIAKIDPYIGWGALTLACFIQGITILYPKTLVSKIEYVNSSKNQKQIHVYGYSLPLLQTASQPHTYNVGQIKMDPKSSDAQQILQHATQDPQTYLANNYKGHLPLSIQDRKIPWLVEVQQSSDMGIRSIQHPDLFLELLLLQPFPTNKTPSTSSNKGKGKNKRNYKSKAAVKR